MTRRSWIVYVDNEHDLRPDDYWNNKYVEREKSRQQIGIFFKEGQAIDYAKFAATQHPDMDVHVYKQTTCFCSKARPAEMKKWNDDGSLTPA